MSSRNASTRGFALLGAITAVLSSACEGGAGSTINPVEKTDASVLLTAGPASTLHSRISATGPVVADGTSVSTVSILLQDLNQNPVTGVTPTLSVSGTGNSVSACSATDATGQSTCTFSSSTAESKSVGLQSPIVLSAITVVFSAPPRNPSAPRSMYVYDGDDVVMDATKQSAMLSFAKSKSLREIFLSADQYFIYPSRLPRPLFQPKPSNRSHSSTTWSRTPSTPGSPTCRAPQTRTSA